MAIKHTAVSYYGINYVEHAEKDFQEMLDHGCDTVILALTEFDMDFWFPNINAIIKKAHEMGFVDGILFAEKKMPVVPKEEEPDEEEKEDTLTAMTYSKSRNLSAFLSKVSASAEFVTGTPIDQLEKRLALLKY